VTTPNGKKYNYFFLEWKTRQMNSEFSTGWFLFHSYQENSLGVNAAGAYGWQPYNLPVPLSWNLGTLTSWNLLGHSRSVMGLIYLIQKFLQSGCFWKSGNPYIKILSKTTELFYYQAVSWFSFP
jgi:hypothetical protein